MWRRRGRGRKEISSNGFYVTPPTGRGIPSLFLPSFFFFSKVSSQIAPPPLPPRLRSLVPPLWPIPRGGFHATDTKAMHLSQLSINIPKKCLPKKKRESYKNIFWVVLWNWATFFSVGLLECIHGLTSLLLLFLSGCNAGRRLQAVKIKRRNCRKRTHTKKEQTRK